MTKPDRHKLLGRYKTPRFKYGQTVICEVRGELKIIELSDGPIPWPIGINRPGDGGSVNKSLVVYKGLARAVRRESCIAIRHWWGVGASTAGKWRKALGVEANNEGTRRRRSDVSSSEELLSKTIAAMVAKARDPQRRAKIAASRLGKKRPKHVVQALRKANLGRTLTAEHRKKMSVAHKRRGTRPPKAGRPWAAEEDDLLRSLPMKEDQWESAISPPDSAKSYISIR